MSKEKPIIFNTEMVRAILDGRKSVTRRVVKPQPVWIEQDKKYRVCPSGWWWGLDCIEAVEDNQLFAQMLKAEAAPYNVGDILYVRETWASDGYTFLYRADAREHGSAAYYLEHMCGMTYDSGLRWRPSIHMPREAARIFLRVTDVRVERLQEINGKGIRAEGFNILYLPNELKNEFNKYGAIQDLEQKKKDFSDLWDSTIKRADLDRYGWAANPWVWVIEFERCEKPEVAV